MHNILVTGASGFIGGHIVRLLCARQIAVRCLVRQTSRLDFIGPSTPEFVWGDVTEPESLKAALDGVDGVIHCAGLTKARSRTEYFRVNAEGSQSLYSACREYRGQLAKIVHISSLSAIGPAIDGRPVEEDSAPHPVSHYGESKLAAQRIAEGCMKELPISIIIPPAVYGPRDLDFFVYFKFVARGFAPLVGRRPRYLSLIYAHDLAEAALQALFSELSTGRSYLVNDGGTYAWTDVTDAIGAVMDRRPRRIHFPVGAARLLGRLGDLGAGLTGKAQLISSQKVREFRQNAWTCSSRRIEEELGFRPSYTLESGMRETYSWYKENAWL
jgi:nucleoside-diphosphate-sugar epimerase